MLQDGIHMRERPESLLEGKSRDQSVHRGDKVTLLGGQHEGGYNKGGRPHSVVEEEGTGARR